MRAVQLEAGVQVVQLLRVQQLGGVPDVLLDAGGLSFVFDGGISHRFSDCCFKF